MIFTRLNSLLKYAYALCVVLGLALTNYLYFQSLSGLTLFLSNLVVLLGTAPLYFWLENNEREAIPLLPVHGLFYAVTFGIAGFSRFKKSIWELWRFEILNDTFNYALVCVIAGLLSLYLAYYVLAPKLISSRRGIPSFPFYAKNTKAYTLLACIGFPLSCFLYWISRQGVLPELTLSFQMVYLFIFYLLMAAYFQGLLTMTSKVVLMTLIFPYQFFIGSGFLEGSIGPLIINLMSVCILSFAIKRKMPWGWMLLIALTISLIQPIKGELRTKIWQLNAQGTASELKNGTNLADSIGWLSEVLHSRYLLKDLHEIDSKSNDNLAYTSNSGSINGRFNLLYPLAWIIQRTPDPQPFLYGSTYIPLLSKWIPRILWENKPRETLGNDWARAYKLAAPDNFSYSYNLPWIAEMYMNVGFLGIVGISLLIGLLFYLFKLTICQVNNDPSKLAFGVLLMTPLMTPESNLSLVLGGVIVSGILISILAYLAAKALPKLFGY